MKTPAETLLISLVQTGLHWEDASANRQMIEQKILAAYDKMEVVVLPEMFSTGFNMKPSELAEEMDGPTIRWMKELTARKKIIMTGSLIIKESGLFYNRMIWVQPDGTMYHYDKRHLFAYAGEDEKFTGGTKRLVVSVKGWKINLQVCYDLRFPVWARQQQPIELSGETIEGPEYDVLIYAANWPERRSHAWKTLLQARAIENQTYVAGVNRTGVDGNGIEYAGDSMIVDPMGAILVTAGQSDGIFTYALTLDSLQNTRDRLPFLKDADPFMIGQKEVPRPPAYH